MSETKWTPGPWVYDPDGKGGKDAMVRANDASIVAVRHRLPGVANEANMRLIASAPDLYAALEKEVLRRESSALGRKSKWLAQARAALARARGEG